MASRREKGLCFSCDEKYHRGHRCASKVFFFIADEEEPPDPPHITLPSSDPDNNPSDSPPTHSETYPTQLSLNSLAGHLAPETLRFVATIAEHAVALLVDGGSTHNFIQQQLVTLLGLSPTTTTPLRMKVGNGQQLDCDSVCQDVPISIHDTVFVVDLHVLPISGANVVLGVQWLKSLGPVLTDYNTLAMQFFYNHKLVQLQGDIDASMNPLSPSQFRRLYRKQGPGFYYHITMLPQSPPELTEHIPDAFRPLLLKYEALFQPPQTLPPPPRATDHHIHLLPQATPVNVRPYRYPHYQKHEIETQVDAMLQQGLIQPSTSPFSSPVLLVKKHNRSWRFCVDYRALNALTIRDRFPIPTIDELLDELGGACCFSKLDLLQGYHRIRMHPDDIPKTTFRTHHGHYEFKVMPFGLCNAPSSFQATMNMLFRPYLCQFIIVFFNDILIYSSSLEDHLLHLDIAFQVLLDNHFVLKISKCFFGQSQVEYLGHLVSHKGVEPLATKVTAIIHWPSPRSTKALRSFLGLAGFYRRFIKGYATIAAPLVKATTIGSFQWTEEA